MPVESLRSARSAFCFALGTGCAPGPGGPDFGGTADGGQTDSSTTTAAASDGLDTTAQTSGFKFDTPHGADIGGGACGCGNARWSYVWVANSSESTVSKVDTRTLVEEGRYLTKADMNGSPSRTSVSVDGRAVAVANRYGGLVKIWARPELCAESNGQAGIQTSSGKADVLPWGEDECVAWFNEFPGATSQRPVQWTPGRLDPDSCAYLDQKIWTVTGGGVGAGFCMGSGVVVHRVDGQTGVVEDSLAIPEAEFPCGPLGAYGGAADADGNLWFHASGSAALVRVGFDDLAYEVFQMPEGFAYGITVDTKARVWLTSPVTQRFDYALDEWVIGAPSTSGGAAQGPGQRMWVSDGDAVTALDLESAAAVDTVPIPGGSLIKGVSVDVDGNVWAVPWVTGSAYRYDPATGDLDGYHGLDEPYTYSDMTGGAIQTVTCRPEG